jgi:hypothetical protein
MEEQNHQPLTFCQASSNSQHRWTVPEKEGFAFVDTVTKVDYLLPSHDEFSILSGHLNLTYIYNPLSVKPYSCVPCCTQVATLGTLDARALVPHGACDGRVQLLDRPYDEMGSRADCRQRAQGTWPDGQPIFAAVHNPARLRYGRVSAEKGDSAGAEECGTGVRAKPA